jgi:hypothetical protein
VKVRCPANGPRQLRAPPWNPPVDLRGHQPGPGKPANTSNFFWPRGCKQLHHVGRRRLPIHLGKSPRQPVQSPACPPSAAPVVCIHPIDPGQDLSSSLIVKLTAQCRHRPDRPTAPLPWSPATTAECSVPHPPAVTSIFGLSPSFCLHI